MAFISDASNFTLGDGVYNNVHGNFVVHNVHNHVYGQKRRREEIDGRDVPLLEGSSNKRRREDSEEEGFEIILAKHLKLTREIGNGPGYFLHAGEHQGRALILKVFNPGPSVRQRMESTVALSQGLMHPNVLRIEGISSPTSPMQFIAYENDPCVLVERGGSAGNSAQRRCSEEHCPRIQNEINHLKVNAISLSSMTVENFNIFLDVNDRFLISINAGSSEGTTSGKFSRAAKDDHGWDLLNLLCQKMFKSANRALHNQEIERHPETLDHLLRQRSNPSSSSAPLFCTPDQCSEDTPQLIPDEQLLPPRREYVWRTLERGKNCLTTVAAQITLDLEMKLSTPIRVVLQDTESPHRCRGYVREEITLATAPAESAVVSHDAPSPLEICPVCCEVVGFHEKLDCICGDPNPSSQYTVKCRVCKFWSHIDCVGYPQHFTCESCTPWSLKFDYDRQCGVINGMNLPCSRSLTCKSHSMSAKGAVEGRSRGYDDLLLDWNRAHNPNFVEPIKRETKAEKKEKKEREKLERKKLAEETAVALGVGPSTLKKQGVPGLKKGGKKATAIRNGGRR